MTTPLDAVVVGAGFAGVTAARDLADRGRSVVVLEAGARTGGRTYSRPFAGHEHIRIELGGSWVNPELQPQLRSEIARYDVALSQDVAPEHAVFLTGGTLRDFPVPAGELSDLERVLGHLRDVSKRISPSLPLSSQPIGDLDVSVEEFLAPLDPGPATRDLVLAMAAFYVGADARNTSVLGLVAQTAAFGHSPLGFYSSLTQRFVGGAGVLLDKMIAGSSLDVRLDHRVVRIEQTGDHVTVTTGDGTSLRAATCVVAVPSNVIRHIEFLPGLAEDKARLLAVNHLGRFRKPSILARHVPRRPYALGMGTLQGVVLGYEYDDGTCLLMGFSDDETLRDPTSRDQVEAAVREYFPEAEVIAVDAHDWSADPLFDGTNRTDRPGEAYAFMRAMREPEGRVAFAGTDVDDSVWRTWIEGAVNTGHRAADQVSALLSAGPASTRTR